MGIASSALGTDVNAGRVQFTYPFGITIDDLTIYDLKHDTLAHAASLSLRLKPVKLLKKKLSITSVRVNSPSIRLNREDPQSDPNYAFLTEMFGSSDEPMSLRANSVLIRNGSIRYDVYSAEWTDSVFNTNHIGVSGLTANLSLKALNQDTVSVIIRKFTFAEQSGFMLNRAKGTVNIGRYGTNLSGFVFSTPNSDFEARRLSADAGFATRLNGLPDADVDIRATLTGSDYKAFYPPLGPMTTPVTLTLKGNGRSGDVNLNALYVQIPDSILDLGLSGTVMLDTTFHVTGCRYAEAHGTFSDELPLWIQDQLAAFSLTIPDQLNSLGDGSFKANYENRSGTASSSLQIISRAGTVNFDINGQGDAYSGNLTAQDVNLRAFTGNRDLGNCSLTASAELQRQDDGFSGRFNGRIGSLRYKRYTYRGVKVDGSFTPDRILTDLKFADKNGALDLTAGIGTGNIPYYAINATADSVNLGAYHLVDRDSMSLSTRLTATIIGHNIDDIIGKLSVDSLYYADTEGDWSMGNMTVAICQYNDYLRATTINSDFMNATMIGNYQASLIPASIAKACSDALPTIGKMVGINLKAGNYAKASNSFTVDVNLRNADFMQKVFHSPISVDQPAHLQMTFIDSKKHYNGTLTERAECHRCPTNHEIIRWNQQCGPLGLIRRQDGRKDLPQCSAPGIGRHSTWRLLMGQQLTHHERNCTHTHPVPQV